MSEVTIIGLDLAKNVFQVHGAASPNLIIYNALALRANAPWHAPAIWGAVAPGRLPPCHWPGIAPPRGRFLLRR